MPSIIFTVTNDLSYDQRMARICTSLSGAGYNVLLVGRKMKRSVPLANVAYAQKRLFCFFEKGKLFYLEYNIRLFIFLLFKKMDGICAIDLDTMLPCYYISRIKKITRILDAHEYFSQQKEIVSRPGIYKIWHWIEKKYLPEFLNGYTVGNLIAAEFNKLYRVNYEVIRNFPLLNTSEVKPVNTNIIIYQGAVNEARGLEYLVPAMKHIEAVLHIYGEGNLMEKIRTLIAVNNLQDKVFMNGMVLPEQLAAITGKARIGINLVENSGLNQYYSLANKFFDLINNAVPQVTMDFPEYKKVNNEFEVAVLIGNLETGSIVKAINSLLQDDQLYYRLQSNCLAARNVFNWQKEEIKLIAFYKKIFG